MKNNKSTTINSLEEALRIFWLENAQSDKPHLSEKEVRLILSTEDEIFQMDSIKREQLINRLYETIQNVSLGQLINERINEQKIAVKTLTRDSRLPAEVFKQLTRDEIYPNNIPLVLMNELFKQLQIKFSDAYKAILKTFEMLQKSTMSNLGNNHLRVTSRTNRNTGGSGLTRGNKPDGRELYENREALDKYLEKLKELMVQED